MRIWHLVVCISAQTIRKAQVPILQSAVYSANVLPSFLFLEGAEEGGSSSVHIGGGRGEKQPFVPSDDADPDIWENANEDLRSPQLPWLTQSQWSCERANTTMPVILLESDGLRATITPQYGGKIWALFDKKNNREMVYNNQAHQPANIGARKAWAAGGIEWNWSPGIIGHSAFTEESVWTAVMETPYGPAVRVYEFDRYNGTVWQVDMIIVNDTLFTHAKISNPTKMDLKGYWWTCVAHHTTPDSRVVTPAQKVACDTSSGYTSAYNKYATGQPDWHQFAPINGNFSFRGQKDSWQHDNSYLGNLMEHNDYFVRIHAPQQPYIAHAAPDGYTVIHAHPLNGTKFFTWGQNGPGRFMQDFLGGGEVARLDNRRGDYTELQIGPAPTQMQTFPLPAFDTFEWTDYYQGWFANVSEIHNSDYNAALLSVGKFMQGKSGISPASYQEIDRFLAFLADQTPAADSIISPGLPWGALEEELIALLTQTPRKQLVPGATFVLDPQTTDDEIVPWVELLGLKKKQQEGTINNNGNNNGVTFGNFSSATLARAIPLSYQTTDNWLAALQGSAAQHGWSWLHHLYVGVQQAEAGAVQEPISHFQSSISMFPDNPIALRCLAVLQNTQLDAYNYFLKAWAVATDSSFQSQPNAKVLLVHLGAEISNFIMGSNLPAKMDKLKSFLATVPASAKTDSIVIAQIQINLADGNYNAALSALGSECFPTIASERPALQRMWYTAIEQREAAKLGRPLTAIEARNARMANFSPRNIGCQYGGQYCREYW